MALTDRQRLLCITLREQHSGKYRAIKGRALAKMLSLPYGKNGERIIQDDIAALRGAGYPVCASVKAPFLGYYWAVDKSDFEPYWSQAEARFRHGWENLRSAVPKERLREIVGQLQLEIGG